MLAPLTFALIVWMTPTYQPFQLSPEVRSFPARNARLRTVMHVHDYLGFVSLREFGLVDLAPQAEDPVYVADVPPPASEEMLPPLPPPPLPPPPEPPVARPPRAPASVARKVTIGIFTGSAVAVFAGSLTLSVVAAKLREQPFVCTANGLLYACQPNFSLPQIIGYNASWLLGTVGIVLAGFR